MVASRSVTPCRKFSAPGGQHHRIVRHVSRRRGRGDPLGGDVDRVDPIGRSVPVLDRATGCARLVEEPNGLRDTVEVVREASLAVDVEREIGRRRDRTDVLDQRVPGHAVVVAALGPREPGAGRGQGLEPGTGEQLGRPDVPRIRHHEHLLAGVQFEEAGPLLLRRHAVILTDPSAGEQRSSDDTVVRSATSRRATSSSRASIAAARAASAKSSPPLA